MPAPVTPTGQYPNTQGPAPKDVALTFGTGTYRTLAVTGTDRTRLGKLSFHVLSLVLRGGEPEVSAQPDAAASGALRAGTAGERDAGRQGSGARCRADAGPKYRPARTLAAARGSQVSSSHWNANERGVVGNCGEDAGR
ncbi:MAG: hypothetical protein ACM3ML_34075 [Micromonosporaceae bacterium]